MKIKKVRIKNFRCFKDELLLDLNENLNVFLGENNIGKSSLFTALNKLKMFCEHNGNYYPEISPQQRPIFVHSDWSLENEENMFIEVVIEIPPRDIHEALIFLDYHPDVTEKTRKDFEENFYIEDISIIFFNKWGSNLLSPIIKIGDYYFRNSEVSSDFNLITIRGGKYLNFKDISLDGELQDFFTISKAIEHRLAANKGFKISLSNQNFYRKILESFFKNIKFFEDIRQKPSHEESSILESYNGMEVASVLSNLKNGDLEKREKWNLIKNEFKKFFPDLSLEIKRDHGEIHIVIIRDEHKYEHLVTQAGTGILEFIIILTNIINSKDKVFIFEEPELHLHPSAQKSLFNLLKETGVNNQEIVITHSPFFINLLSPENNHLLRKKGKSISFYRIDSLTSQEINKFQKEFQNKKEIFFSKKVILVEGETECGALPIFAEKLRKDLDINNFFICSVGGKRSFRFYQKILENLGIDYVVLCDEDEEELPQNISSIANKIILKPNFEEFLRGKGFEDIINSAKSQYKKSKPLMGKEIAMNIPIEQIPQEIKDLFGML